MDTIITHDGLWWKEFCSRVATPVFYQCLDYVGLDCFPDVFRPLPRSNGVINAYEPIRQLISYFKSDNRRCRHP